MHVCFCLPIQVQTGFDAADDVVEKLAPHMKRKSTSERADSMKRQKHWLRRMHFRYSRKVVRVCTHYDSQASQT